MDKDAIKALKKKKEKANEQELSLERKEKNKKLAHKMKDEFESVDELEDFFSILFDLVSGKGLILS